MPGYTNAEIDLENSLYRKFDRNTENLMKNMFFSVQGQNIFLQNYYRFGIFVQ